MRRISLWILSTLSAVVVLFSYHTSTDGPAVAASSSVLSATSDTTSATVPAPTTAAVPSEVDASETTAAQTYTGSAASTRYGAVQVQITVSAGRITDATAVDYPDGNGKDQQINARAVPTLESETVAAQSADIHMVSGATYTSDGYVQSLQSAIDQAHLG
jgi:uncharacterized protein with FMN-binding domain